MSAATDRRIGTVAVWTDVEAGLILVGLPRPSHLEEGAVLTEISLDARQARTLARVLLARADELDPKDGTP